MKNIFKKNSIIITALAIMIVIAGYLSFTNRDAANNTDAIATSGSVGGDFDVVTDTTPDATTTPDDTTTNDDTTTDDDVIIEDVEDAEDDDTNAATDELGSTDISDEDLLAESKEVSDNGEINLEDGTPGDAVLASASVDGSYFNSVRLEREQTRAKNKDTLMDIIESTSVTEEAKQDALDGMIELTGIMEKESATEMLLGAKGFDDSIVFILDNKVDVVVNAASLTDQQLAIIEDVVKNETGIAVKNIQIIPTVVEE